MAESEVELDVALLAGFDFACRPGCGLCCYAEPRVEPEERRRLVRILPEIEFVERAGDRFLASFGNGGACRLLRENRCRVHDARPHPCREFPLTAHVGERLQASVVLSCPGVDLAGLGRTGTGRASSEGVGFVEELGALRERVDSAARARVEAARRRRRKVARALAADGRWEEEGAVRERLGRALPMPTPRDFPVEDPPTVEEGLDRLPLFFDGRAAPVALAGALGGWQLLELRPAGGSGAELGILPPPERPPALEPAAAELLTSYLRYWLRRDALFAIVHLEMLRSDDRETVGTWVEAELRRIGALVTARADVRARLHRGVVDRLSAADVANGIRATDQDLLDRDGWGDRL